jgi:hypothetical protein
MVLLHMITSLRMIMPYLTSPVFELVGQLLIHVDGTAVVASDDVEVSIASDVTQRCGKAKTARRSWYRARPSDVSQKNSAPVAAVWIRLLEQPSSSAQTRQTNAAPILFPNFHTSFSVFLCFQSVHHL